MTARRSATPPTRKPSSREQLAAKRSVVATGPSGENYLLRPLNVQRHALSGGLPSKLRQLAFGSDAVAAALAGEDDEESKEAVLSTRSYLDQVVLALVVEPKLTLEDLGTGELNDDPVLPGIDYAWLTDVAFGRAEYDAEGRHLFGVEPLNRFARFRDEHGCSEGCAACLEARRKVSAAQE